MFSLPTKSTGRALFAVTVALACTPAAAVAQDLRSPDARDAALAHEHSFGSYQSDANAARSRGAARLDLRSPDTRDIADGREYPPTPIVVTLKATNAPDPAPAAGFDWAAALVGAAAALGAILLAAAAVIVVRRRAYRDQPIATT